MQLVKKYIQWRALSTSNRTLNDSQHPKHRRRNPRSELWISFTCSDAYADRQTQNSYSQDEAEESCHVHLMSNDQDVAFIVTALLPNTEVGQSVKEIRIP